MYSRAGDWIFAVSAFAVGYLIADWFGYLVIGPLLGVR